jgi:L-asparaginase II
MSEAPVVIEVVRGTIVESRHRAIVSVVDPLGKNVVSFGDTGFVTYLRSSAKPFQAMPLISSGAAREFGFTQPEIAIVCGSHTGESFHTETVERILAKTGVNASSLKCGIHTPFDSETAQRLGESGITVLHNNCSGKHAGMLALARFRGHETETHLEPEHPVQREILDVLSRFASMKPEEIGIGVDGCSAPNFAMPVEKMALMYARLVNPDCDHLEEPFVSAAKEIVRAMAEHPEMVGGTRGRLDTDLIRASAGRIISKVGAEGVYTIGVLPNSQFPNGIGIAIKIESGDVGRIRNLVAVEVLRQLGVLDQSILEKLSAYRDVELKNHRGIRVGVIRPAFQLQVNYE